VVTTLSARHNPVTPTAPLPGLPRPTHHHRKNAWGYDEANVASHSPSAWFDLGLTIVDSIDTLLVAGLLPEYQEARHWVANHLHFPDGSTVQVGGVCCVCCVGGEKPGTVQQAGLAPRSAIQLPPSSITHEAVHALHKPC
jgi:hypothetical protein